jgi:hypothetical protein
MDRFSYPGFLMKVPFEDRSDVVFSIGVIHQLESLERALQMIVLRQTRRSSRSASMGARITAVWYLFSIRCPSFIQSICRSALRITYHFTRPCWFDY